MKTTRSDASFFVPSLILHSSCPRQHPRFRQALETTHQRWQNDGPDEPQQSQARRLTAQTTRDGFSCSNRQRQASIPEHSLLPAVNTGSPATRIGMQTRPTIMLPSPVNQCLRQWRHHLYQKIEYFLLTRGTFQSEIRFASGDLKHVNFVLEAGTVNWTLNVNTSNAALAKILADEVVYLEQALQRIGIDNIRVRIRHF